MPLSTTLPPWLTQTPDPSGIIGRGSAAGGQAADARNAAERLMAQREQFAQEFTLKQAALEQEAEKAAAMLAARDQELEIRKMVAESDIAKDAQQSLRLAKDYELRAKQSADMMLAKYATLKQQREIADAANANRVNLKALDQQEREIDRLFKGSEGDKNRDAKANVPDKPTTDVQKSQVELNKLKAEGLKQKMVPEDALKSIDKAKKQIAEDEAEIAGGDLKTWSLGSRKARIESNKALIKSLEDQFGISKEASGSSEKRLKFNPKTGMLE